VDAVQIAAALDTGADAFLTNDKKLAGIKEIKMLVLSDYLPDTRIDRY
jgi:predicted nucleic acid-binding protein